MDKSKPSWKEDALKAIENYNCALLLFYVNQNSLISAQCLSELDKTDSKETQETHFGKVEYVAIDAEMVGHIGEFMSAISLGIEQCNISSAEKVKKQEFYLDLRKNGFLKITRRYVFILK